MCGFAKQAFLSYPYREFSFIEPVGVLSQHGFDWIAPNVPYATFEMCAVSDNAVEVVALPERSIFLKRLVDDSCAETFPALDNLRQLPLRMQHEEEVHVIWHDDSAQHVVARILKMKQGFGHLRLSRFFLQQTTAVACIHPLVQPLGEARVELEFNLPRPGFGMLSLPCFAFLFPLRDQTDRNGVSQAKGDEIHGSPLLPMWQPIASFHRLGKRIEEGKVLWLHCENLQGGGEEQMKAAR